MTSSSRTPLLAPLQTMSSRGKTPSSPTSSYSGVSTLPPSHLFLKCYHVLVLANIRVKTVSEISCIRLGKPGLHFAGRQNGFDGLDVIDRFFNFSGPKLEECLFWEQEGVIADGQCVYPLRQAF